MESVKLLLICLGLFFLILTTTREGRGK